VAQTPLPANVAAGVVVAAARLSLHALGAGETANSLGALVALHFLAGFKARARDPVDPSFERFASLAGTLEAGSDGQFKLNIAKGAVIQHAAPAQTDGGLSREVRLEYSTGFVVADGADVGRLRLPAEPADARHLEVAVELVIDGEVVAEVKLNDRLDIPLLGEATITLLDDENLPISGAEFVVLQGSREIQRGVLDQAGSAFLRGLPANCSVQFPGLDPSELRSISAEDVPPELLDPANDTSEEISDATFQA
jgi:hypothetical protein